MQMLRFAVAGLLWVNQSLAHGPITTQYTYSKEISRIIYKHCGSCHRPNGQAPFSLLTYAEARPWAVAIKEEVLERRMPPWNAVKGFGHFRDEMALTWEDIHAIADWTEGGAPEGDPKFLPPKPNYTLAETESVPKTELKVRSRVLLSRAVVLAAVRPVDVPEGVTLRAVARRPDGRVEPLIWIHAYKPKWQRAYYFARPLKLPAGTSIELSPPNAGTILLIQPE
jgi:mono/diheme cytochrome c family protein